MSSHRHRPGCPATAGEYGCGLACRCTHRPRWCQIHCRWGPPPGRFAHPGRWGQLAGCCPTHHLTAGAATAPGPLAAHTHWRSRWPAPGPAPRCGLGAGRCQSRPASYYHYHSCLSNKHLDYRPIGLLNWPLNWFAACCWPVDHPTAVLAAGVPGPAAGQWSLGPAWAGC